MKKNSKNTEFAAELSISPDEISPSHENRFENSEPKPEQNAGLPGEIEKTHPQES